jgi:hypothetical protein
MLIRLLQQAPLLAVTAMPNLVMARGTSATAQTEQGLELLFRQL